MSRAPTPPARPAAALSALLLSSPFAMGAVALREPAGGSECVFMEVFGASQRLSGPPGFLEAFPPVSFASGSANQCGAILKAYCRTVTLRRPEFAGSFVGSYHDPRSRQRAVRFVFSGGCAGRVEQ